MQRPGSDGNSQILFLHNLSRHGAGKSVDAHRYEGAPEMKMKVNKKVNRKTKMKMNMETKMNTKTNMEIKMKLKVKMKMNIDMKMHMNVKMELDMHLAINVKKNVNIKMKTKRNMKLQMGRRCYQFAGYPGDQGTAPGGQERPPECPSEINCGHSAPRTP
jgi:hypothetical protein